ncbi:MAG: hypothetical protein GY826_10500, partial [Fuerstiella sp.]|nr:hypothetical protein [Fuerstiella sp.]
MLSSPTINENGSVTLTGTVSDQGVYDDLDEVTIQWGDGANSVVTLAG